MRLKLPHIPRIFTAVIFPGLAGGLLWGGFLSLIGLNILMWRTKSVAYTSSITNTLTHPFSAAAHEELALALWNSGARALAQKEAALAAELSPVLGETTTTREVREAEELKYWQDQVANHPDYRDAYIQLAALSYEQGNVLEAKRYLLSAQALDPDNGTLSQLLKFISSLR